MTQQLLNPFEIIDQRLSNIENKLNDLKNSRSEKNFSHEQSEDIGGIELAEKIIGLAKPTIYALVSKSKIPFMKQGKRLYFSRQELTEWIKSGRNKTLLEKEIQLTDCLKPSKKRTKV